MISSLAHVLLAKIGVSSCRCVLPEEIDSMSLSKKDVDYNFRNTNNLLFISHLDKKYVFRATKRHLPIKDYLRNAFSEFLFLTDYRFESFQIESIIGSPRDLLRFWFMGTKDAPRSRISRFFSEHNPQLVGIQSVSEADWEGVELFLNYIWSEIYSHRMTSIFDKWQSCSAAKILAQKACAEVLGVGNLICGCRFVRLKIDETEFLGTIQPFVPGIKTNRTLESKLQTIMSPVLQKELTTLNILDYINYEKDHRPGNYMVVLDDNGKGASLVAYDNDSPMCFFPNPLSAFHSYKNSSSLIVKGHYNRPFIDALLKERLMSITCKEVHSALKNYLNKIQLWALWRRIVNIRRALKHTNESMLTTLSDGEWNSILLDKERSGKYGRTYLSIFLTQQEPSL